jgi:hypothetical protein
MIEKTLNKKGISGRLAQAGAGLVYEFDCIKKAA